MVSCLFWTKFLVDLRCSGLRICSVVSNAGWLGNQWADGELQLPKILLWICVGFYHIYAYSCRDDCRVLGVFVLLPSLSDNRIPQTRPEGERRLLLVAQLLRICGLQCDYIYNDFLSRKYSGWNYQHRVSRQSGGGEEKWLICCYSTSYTATEGQPCFIQRRR